MNEELRQLRIENKLLREEKKKKTSTSRQRAVPYADGGYLHRSYWLLDRVRQY